MKQIELGINLLHCLIKNIRIMKKILFSFIACCLLFTGYAQTESKTETNVSMEKVVESYKEFGIGEDAIKNSRSYLIENGINEDIANYVLIVSIRIFTNLEVKGDNTKLPDWAVKHYSELSITKEQMETIKNCNMRFAQMVSIKKEQGISDEFKKFGITDIDKIKSQLEEIGVKEEQMQGVLGGMIRLMQMLKNDEKYIPDENMNNYLTNEVGLTKEQSMMVFRKSQEIVFVKK